MRILLVHNYLRPPSGENTVFEQERALLEQHGHAVHTYTRDNAELDASSRLRRLAIPLTAHWSLRSRRELRRCLAESAAEIVHFHNTFPLISPAALRTCHRAGVAVVHTLHHFRLVCPGALLYRDGAICEACSGQRFWPAIRHGCYHGSSLQTAGVASMLLMHRWLGTWSNCVDSYIALSDFAAAKMRAMGLPATHIDVKPNFLADPPTPGAGTGPGLFVGRIGAEKGIDCLVAALRRFRRPFSIAGTGPDAERVRRALASVELAHVEWLGLLDHAAATRRMRDAAFAVFPSVWYEGMPMVVLEAMAAARPVIASRIGALGDLIVDGETGLLVEPGDHAGLAAAMQRLHDDPGLATRMGRRARQRFEQHFMPAANHQALLEIYRRAVARRRASLTR